MISFDVSVSIFASACFTGYLFAGKLTSSSDLPTVASAALTTLTCCKLWQLTKTYKASFVVLLICFNALCFACLEPHKSDTRRAIFHCLFSLLACGCNHLVRIAKQMYNFRKMLKSINNMQGYEAPKAPSDAKIMILYANVGSGHKRAAQAVDVALKSRGVPPEHIVSLDVLEHCTPTLKFFMQSLFQTLTQSLAGQHVLGLLYDQSDRGNQKSMLQAALENGLMVEVLSCMRKFEPNVIVCTHFLPAQFVCMLKQNSRRFAAHVTIAEIITDLDLQSMWMQPEIDAYFLPREDAKLMLEAYRQRYPFLAQNEKCPWLSQEKPHAIVSGIPIMPDFKAALIMEKGIALDMFELGRDDPRPVVVVTSGGTLISEVYREVLAVSTPMRVVVVMGRQENVVEELTKIDVPEQHATKLLGFVSEMPALLRCADIIVGKSGGLTVAEAAALKVPMIVLDPIPGQETRNADVLLECGAAFKINDLPLLRHRVEKMLCDKGKVCKVMQRCIETLAYPDSAFTVADAILDGSICRKSDGAKKTD